MTDDIAHECLVCGTALDGPLGSAFRLFGIKRSSHNPNVCNRCAAHLEEGRIIEMSVLFADLTGFTGMTNRLGPDRSYEVLNAFFAMANDVLVKNDAFIDKYIGDAVMALFNAPIRNEKHARGAATAARGILEGLKRVSENMVLDLKARIGVSTGYARVGSLGSTDRSDYTAIGDVVNLASRLVALARPGEVIVDGETFRRISEEFSGLSPETVEVKGFAEPIKVCRLTRSEREDAPVATTSLDTMAARQRIGLGAVLFTVFGAPCAITASLSPLAILLGLGSFMTALGPVFNALDAAQIRIPLQVLAVLGAGINLFVIRQGRATRRRLGSEGLTGHERRKVRFVIGLAIVSLLAVAFEAYVHIVVQGMSYFYPTL